MYIYIHNIDTYIYRCVHVYINIYVYIQPYLTFTIDATNGKMSMQHLPDEVLFYAYDSRSMSTSLNSSFDYVHHVCGTTDSHLTAVNTNDGVAFLQIDFCLLLEKLVNVRPYHFVVSHGIR